ncbi:nuclear transport factor 2 family protein [Microbacterium sp. STN6]|uniref:nuclear transport factor 2 family protein n=1 Tax=Microbacterium sp. STN6 TaxID=2995588 RepID=UPI002260B279|nr:nuclear transport factor 2 family protein [Microbacterium sp. STN6]MCX7522027.1 nuclear transport factor 2 family protein [Microbacterium sp. STN6]
MAETKATLLEDLLTLERRGWDALCSRSGADFYADIMRDDAVMVLSNGTVLDRSAVVASLNEAPPWRDYTIIGPTVITIDSGVAALVYTAIARREDEDPAFQALMSSVYVRDGSAWTLALYQQTPIPVVK